MLILEGHHNAVCLLNLCLCILNGTLGILGCREDTHNNIICVGTIIYNLRLRNGLGSLLGSFSLGHLLGLNCGSLGRYDLLYGNFL